MRRLILYIALYLGCAFATCLNVVSANANEREEIAPRDEGRYQAYVEKIAEAHRDAAGILKTLELPSIKSFQELAAAGAENIELSVRFLKEEGREDKLFVILSMYKLDVDGYDVFVRKLLELHRRSPLSDTELYYGLLPRFSALVVEQYRNPKIQALLKEAEARDDIPAELKATIRSFRSGERFAWKRTSDFDRECMRWSEIHSISKCVSLVRQIVRVYAVSWMTR